MFHKKLPNDFPKMLNHSTLPLARCENSSAPSSHQSLVLSILRTVIILVCVQCFYDFNLHLSIFLHAYWLFVYLLL